MASRLRPLESTGLYLLILAFSLFFFIAGVLVGRLIPAQADPPELVSENEVVADDSEQDLGFYRELVGGQDEQGESGGKEESVPATTPQILSPTPAQPPEVQTGLAQEASGRSFYTVQVGAIENRRTVNQIVMRLTAKGYPSRVVEPGKLDNKAYLIWVEDCETHSEAEQLEARLKEDGFQTYIKQVREPVR